MPSSCRGRCADGSRCNNPPSDGYFCHLHEAGSRYISKSTREEVFEQSNGNCFYCRKQIVFKNRSSGRGVWEPDHLIPYSQGGSNNSSNLVAACKDCNRSKSDQGIREFNGGGRRCEALTLAGVRCSNDASAGYKYCHHHKT